MNITQDDYYKSDVVLLSILLFLTIN